MLALLFTAETVSVVAFSNIYQRNKELIISCTSYIYEHIYMTRTASGKKVTYQDIILVRAVRLGVQLEGALPPVCSLFRRWGCPYSVGLQEFKDEHKIYIFFINSYRKCHNYALSYLDL